MDGLRVDVGANSEGFVGDVVLWRDGGALYVRGVGGATRGWRSALMLLAVPCFGVAEVIEPRWAAAAQVLSALAAAGFLAGFLGWVLAPLFGPRRELRFLVACVRLVETDSLDFNRRDIGGNPYRLAFEAEDGAGERARFVLDAHNPEGVAALLQLLTP